MTPCAVPRMNPASREIANLSGLRRESPEFRLRELFGGTGEMSFDFRRAELVGHLFTRLGRFRAPALPLSDCLFLVFKVEREKKNYEGTEEPSLGGTSARSLGPGLAMVPSVATGRTERPGREHGRRARDGGGDSVSAVAPAPHRCYPPGLRFYPDQARTWE